jgi:hypothetical protein
MDPRVVNSYTSLSQEFASGFVLQLAVKSQGILITSTNQIPATLTVLILVIISNYLTRRISTIPHELLQDFLSTLIMFVRRIFTYLLIALIDSALELNSSTPISFSTFYPAIILIVTMSLIVTLLKLFSDELHVGKSKTAKLTT